MNPVAKRTGGQHPSAPRVDTLSDKTVGVYWNTKKGGDVLLQRLSELIQQSFPDVRFKKYSHMFPFPSDLIKDMISECDAVVGSAGD